MKDKLWKDCPAEEKLEVKRIEDKLRNLRKKHAAGKISNEYFQISLSQLELDLDEVEKKYE